MFRPNQIITATVHVRRVTKFYKENYHIPTRDGQPFMEKNWCVSMQADDGQWYIVFTKGKFGTMVEEGQTLTVKGGFKREQDHDGVHGIVLNRPKIVA